jgi:hypothetical protein
MSTLNEEGVMNVKQVACDRLLSSRVETKLQVCLHHPSLLYSITSVLGSRSIAAHCLSAIQHGLKQLCVSVPVTSSLLARTRNHMLNVNGNTELQAPPVCLTASPRYSL